MKRSKIAVLVVILAYVTYVLCACVSQPPVNPPANDYRYNSSEHWHVTTEYGVEKMTDKASHVFDDGVATTGGVRYTCTVCGYSHVQQPHEHTFSATFVKDDTHHWHTATCGHNVTSEKQPHTFDNGVADGENVITYTCTACGYSYVDDSHSTHVHTFESTYSFNATSHFYKCTCGHDVVYGQEPHTLVNGVCTVCGFSAQAVDLTFVSLNDVHGYIEQENGKNGLSNTAYAIDQLSQFSGNDGKMVGNNEDIVLFANGDMFQGTAISNMSYGLAVVNAMNEMGFAGMGIGNHEFDWDIGKILGYWDGNASNGEANFPLVSSNVLLNSSNVLLGDSSSTDNIVSSLMIEKQGVKVGLISVIGPCENSILTTRLANYYFQNVVSSVEKQAKQLKKDGAQIVSVNIHYGSSSGISDYYANEEIANLTDGNGDYLVDLIFNGHTHTLQRGVITRSNGTVVPVVQGGGYNSGYAYVKLTYNPSADEVEINDYNYAYVSDVGTNKIDAVERVVSNFHTELLSNLPTLATSATTVRYKSNLYNYMGELMVNAFGSSYAISNNGGLRGNGGITANKAITEANLYEIIPFDNEVYFITMKGSALYRFYSGDNAYGYTGDYYYYGKSSSAPSFSSLEYDSRYYTVAVIDYVYTSEYFIGDKGGYAKDISSEINTHLLLRDILVEDVTLWGKSGTRWTYDKGVKIGLHQF